MHAFWEFSGATFNYCSAKNCALVLSESPEGGPEVVGNPLCFPLVFTILLVDVKFFKQGAWSVGE